MSKYPNSGVLFKNAKKNGDKQPDYTGNCEVNGKQMDMAAWLKEGKSGKFMAISFQEPWRKQAGDDDTAPRGRRNAAEDDEIPF